LVGATFMRNSCFKVATRRCALFRVEVGFHTHESGRISGGWDRITI
jgi:hypothetical protein